MDFWAAIQVVRRRWYVVVAAFVLSIALAALVYKIVPTQYESTGVAVLTSPANGAKFSEQTKPQDIEKINPLLAFDSSLTTTAEIMGQILRDPQTQDELGAGVGAPATYVIANGDATTSGPFIFVTVTGNSPESSQGLVARVLDRTARELRDRQHAVDAPESTFIQAEILVKPTTPEAKVNGKIRFAGAALVLALIATLAATFSVDNVLLNRRRRRDRDDLFPDQEEVDAPSGPPAGVLYPERVVAGHESNGAVHNGLPAAVGPAHVPAQAPAPTPSPVPRRPSPAPRPAPVDVRPAASSESVFAVPEVDPTSETIQIPSRRPRLAQARSNGSVPVPDDQAR